MQEVWKPVVGYEGLYEVSNMGEVRGLPRTVLTQKGWYQHVKGITLRQKNTKDGYKEVTLLKGSKPKSIRAHRVVAFAFLGAPSSPDLEVNHKDGNKQNNCVSNLEWVTSSENQKHAYRMGLQKVSGNPITGRKPVVCLTLQHYEPSYRAMVRYLASKGYCRKDAEGHFAEHARKSKVFDIYGLRFSTEEGDINNARNSHTR